MHTEKAHGSALMSNGIILSVYLSVYVSMSWEKKKIIKKKKNKKEKKLTEKPDWQVRPRSSTDLNMLSALKLVFCMLPLSFACGANSA